jgi:hypothetical protein
MSSSRALTEFHRCLDSQEPQILSISGLWGVGKTHAWRTAIDKHRKSGALPMSRYAYASAFGMRSLEELKATVFQSTVRLDREEIEPTVGSFTEHVKSINGLGALAERGGRSGLKLFENLVSMIPYAGKSAGLLLPSASLLIKNQIVCLDDIERSGEGLNIGDILGFASMLKEERKCKVILLLNDQSLGEQESTYKTYLEKVVDQAVTYLPTAHQSASIALNINDPIEKALFQRVSKLGIVNIRVINRLKKFTKILYPTIADFNEKLLKQAISTIALAGWSIFEPNIAPEIERLLKYHRYSGMLSEKETSAEDAELNSMLSAYGFSHFDDFDLSLLDGLKNGNFDEERIISLGEVMHEQFEQHDAHAEIHKSWEIYGGSFDDNSEELIDCFKLSVENFGEYMSPGEIDNIISTVEELGKSDVSDELVETYMEKQGHRDRGFFELSSHRTISRPIDSRIVEAFKTKLEAMPLERDPAGILLEIGRSNGWNPKDVEYLASLTDDQLYEMFKNAKGDDLRDMLRPAIRFGQSHAPDSAEALVGEKTQVVLRRISGESKLNEMRVRPYLITAEPEEGD